MAQQELEARRKENRQHSSKSIFTRSLYAVTVVASTAQRSGTLPTSTAVSYGSATTSSRLTRSAQLPISGKGVIKEVFIKALNKLVTDKGPALDMMETT